MNDANRFEPASIPVASGTRVTWKNVSQVAHTVTADPNRATNRSNVALPAGVQPWDSGDVGPGQSFSYTFDVAGTYRYICVPHEALGMVGTLTVGG